MINHYYIDKGNATMIKKATKRNLFISSLLIAFSIIAAACSNNEVNTTNIGQPNIEKENSEPTNAKPSLRVVDLGLSGALTLLENGEATSYALVSEYLARIEAYDNEYGTEPGLHAIITVNKNVLDEAKKLDEERAAGKLRGPLHGIPLIIKDNYATADMPTTNGSLAFANYQAEADATIVTKLREAGAIILAKSNMSEFAWSGNDSVSSIRGEVRNPYDQTRTSSGSSGGTGAAIAASLAAAGFGSDTYGSIRNPSAHQALVGVRPTHGLISIAGVTPQIGPLDTVGPMTVSVHDAAILLDAVAGYDAQDPYTKALEGTTLSSYTSLLSVTALQGTTIGFIDQSDDPDNTYVKQAAERNEVLALVNQAKVMLEARGATVIMIKEEDLNALQGYGWQGMKSYVDQWLEETKASWPEGLAALAEPADSLTLDDYIADGQAIPEIMESKDWLLHQDQPAIIEATEANKLASLEKLSLMFSDLKLDAIVYATDTITAAPIPVADSYSNDTWSGFASGLGLPVVTVPAGFTSSGLPAGISFLGLPYTEAELLAYAYDYEQATHHRKAPSSTPELSFETASSTN